MFASTDGYDWDLGGPKGNAKPVLGLDFDGVLNSYTSGWQGAETLPDPPTPGALEFLQAVLPHFNVYIHSSRMSDASGRYAVEAWMERHFGAEIAGSVVYATSKPPAKVTLDDRAMTFTGTWPSLSELKEFEPWTHLSPGRPIPPGVSRALRVLNEALVADRAAILDLLAQRVECNAALARHPSIQTQRETGKEGDGATTWSIGTLGLLNGLFGADGERWGFIALEVDERGAPLRFRVTPERAQTEPGETR